MAKKQVLKKVLIDFDENLIGLYITTIDLDYDYENYTELAQLVEQVFGMKCTKENIEQYYSYHLGEDYEKESRMIKYNLNPEICQ